MEVFSYATGEDLLKIGCFNKATRNLLEENAMKPIISDEGRAQRRLRLNRVTCVQIPVSLFAFKIAKVLVLDFTGMIGSTVEIVRGERRAICKVGKEVEKFN